MLPVVGRGASVVARVCRRGLLDEEAGDWVGVEAGVRDLDVFPVRVVDHFPPLIPVDVGGRPRAVHHLALQPHWRAFLDVEVLVPQDQRSGL